MVCVLSKFAGNDLDFLSYLLLQQHALLHTAAASSNAFALRNPPRAWLTLQETNKSLIFT